MPLVSDQPIFTIHSPLGDIQKLGNTPYGERRIIDILGGTVDGPKLKGKVLPGGADWQIVRADGVVHLTARYTIETDTGGADPGQRRGLPPRPARGDGAARPRRDRRPVALLFPHLHAVRDRRPGGALAQPHPGASAMARGMKGAVRIEVFEVL